MAEFMQTLHQEYARFQVRFGAHLLGVVKIGSFNGTEFPNVKYVELYGCATSDPLRSVGNGLSRALLGKRNQ